MKKILFIIISFCTIVGCQTYEKIELPTNETFKVEFSKEIKYSGTNREAVYDNLIKWVYLKYSVKEIKQQSKTDGIISLLGRNEYLYRDQKKLVGYKLVLMLDEKGCKVVITNINIMKGKNIEFFYDDYNKKSVHNGSVKKLTEAFQSISDSLNDLLNEIEREINK